MPQGTFGRHLKQHLRPPQLHPAHRNPRPKQATSARRAIGHYSATSFRRILHRAREALEKVVGQLFGRAIDQPLAKLRQLAANLRFNLIR